MNFSRQDVLNMLTNSVVTVTFTKVNGEERVMRCTLLSEYMPNGGGPTLLQEGKNNNLSVWDVDANGWRSFRLDSVKSILTE